MHTTQPPRSFLADFQPSSVIAHAALPPPPSHSTPPDYRIVLQEIHNLLQHDASPTSDDVACGGAHKGFPKDSHEIVSQDTAADGDGVGAGGDTHSNELATSPMTDRPPSQPPACTQPTCAATTQTDDHQLQQYNADTVEHLWDAIATLQDEVHTLHTSLLSTQQAMREQQGHISNVLSVIQTQLGYLTAASSHHHAPSSSSSIHYPMAAMHGVTVDALHQQQHGVWNGYNGGLLLHGHHHDGGFVGGAPQQGGADL